MKIVQVGSFPLDSSVIKGGVEASVYGLASELSKSDQVFVIDIPRKDVQDRKEETDALTIYRFHNDGVHQQDVVRRVPDVIALIRRIGPDVCHIHGTSLFCWRLFQGLKKNGCPVVVTVHGLVFVEKYKSLKRRVSLKGLYQFLSQSWSERRLLCHADHVIVDTKYVEKAIDHFHLRSKPEMHVIPQGINEVFYSVSCSASSSGVLSVGNFSHRKGHLLLIKAFELVCNVFDDALLTVCGGIADENYYQEVVSYVEASPYRKKIEIKSNVSNDELLSQYQSSHVFALHSQEESQGIVLAEAMATGLPVVSTIVGGIPYVIESGKTGLLTEYGDVRAFAQSILRLLRPNSDWEVMSERCRAESVAYSWKRIADGVRSVYQLVK